MQELFKYAIKTTKIVKIKIMDVLIVDDHPMTVSGYIESLSSKDFFLTPLSFFKAYSCEEAFHKITSNPSIELAILDYSLPPYLVENINSGSDLAKQIKKQNPHCKIIIITAHTEVITVYDIVKSAIPDGIIIKNDLTPENLPVAVLEVIQGTIFQSRSVKNILQEIWKKDLMIDDVNRQILLYLSKGYKVKDLEAVVMLSMSAIQRRISQMKDVFNVSEDSSLVKEAILQDFL